MTDLWYFCLFQFLLCFSCQAVRGFFFDIDEIPSVDRLGSYFYFFVSAWGQSSGSRLGVVVEAKNFTLPAGSTAILPCQSPRMVWTHDRLKDRQRVVHWDLVRSSPDYSAERILDMSPGARQRVYNSFNKGRISIPDSAFNDGNFSLVINSKISLHSNLIKTFCYL